MLSPTNKYQLQRNKNSTKFEVCGDFHEIA